MVRSKNRFLALFVLLGLLANILYAQTDSNAPGKDNVISFNGLRFESGLSWEEIQAKAKAENKMIFIDCYATWCGPCKAMDETVYPLMEVGNAYNEGYISVKLQMDKTERDNDTIKSWYKTVSQFESNYTINAYPTFLFFDSSGKLLHKVVGRKSSAYFIQLAADAQNPEKQYYNVLKNFRPGKLETAELKGLARLFLNSDTVLSWKIGS